MNINTDNGKEVALTRKPKALRNLILSSLGALVLIIFFLLLGCGSDSKPAKNEKAAASTVANKQSLARLVIGDKQTSPGEGGKVKKEPESQLIKIFPGVTREDIEVRARAAQKEFEKPTTEIFPGITRKEVEARIEASPKELPPDAEIIPGITRKEIEARLAAEGQARDSRMREVIPGVTLEELNAKRAPEAAPDMMREMFPPSGEKK
jgi:hypothetical protein